MGVPAEPKKSAIALCELASRTDDPDRALLAWARKNGRGTFRPDVAGGLWLRWTGPERRMPQLRRRRILRISS
jgi:hypothetical protein